MATITSTLATKSDLKEAEATIVKWIAGLMIGETAALIALLKLLK